MTSVVRFEEWQEPTGTSAATVDGSGNVTFDNDVTVSGGATVSGDLTVTGNMTSANQGLVLIKSVTIGNAVSSVTVTDAFSSTFDNYRILLVGVTANANSSEIGIKLGSVTSGYYGSAPYWNHTGSNGVVTTSGAANDYPVVTFTGTLTRTSASIDVLGPHLAVFTQGSATSHCNDLTIFAGFLENSATQHTDFTLLRNGGTMTGGTVRVYGYAQ